LVPWCGHAGIGPSYHRSSFSKLKQFRAAATRFDERQAICRGTIGAASIRIWLRDPVP